MADNDHSNACFIPTRHAVLFSIFALGVSCVMTQLSLMREMLSAFAGNEMVLGVVLGLWLLLMGLGTTLGRTADRLCHPLGVLALAQILIAIIPMAQVFALRTLRNVVFVRGAEVGVTGTVLSAAVLLLPYCVLAGYALTLACAILNRNGNASGAGRVYVADTLGSIVGGVLFSFVLVRWLDHTALLAAPAILNLVMAGWIIAAGARRSQTIALWNPLRWEVFILTLLAGISAFVWLANSDARSTSLQFPGQNVLFRANSPYGRLVITESGGQTNFIENGVVIAFTPCVEQVEEAAHYAMSQRPDARRVLLVSGGVAGVAKEILKYDVAAVDCVELDPLVVETGRRFLPENTADPRIHMIMTDGRRFIRQTTNRYEVVILALPDPSTAQLNRFFTVEFFGEVSRALMHDGVLALAVGRYENYVSPELARLLATAHRTLRGAFTNVVMLPGGRVFFLASDGPLGVDIADRLERAGIQTRFVNRHYLDAMLTPDRLGDLEHAATVAAPVNRDFNPVLYFYHLRHWASQFNWRVGVVEIALGLAMLVYVARLRGAQAVVFAGGFASSSLEVVLLLGFQAMCGSLYHQLGIIVTVFMAGLALGAAWANRICSEPGKGGGGCPHPADPARSESAPYHGQARRLSHLALALAGLGLLLPLALASLSRASALHGSTLVVQAAIALLTLVLAALVGAEFPLACRIESGSATRAASRVYTADFLGACLGALLASAWLIPALGVTGFCLLTAALNMLASCALFWRMTSA